MDKIVKAVERKLAKAKRLEVDSGSKWTVGGKRLVWELAKARVRLELACAGIGVDFAPGGAGMVVYRYPDKAEVKADDLQGELLRLGAEMGDLCRRMEALRERIGRVKA